MSTLAQLRTQARLKAAVPSADYSTSNLTLQINNAYYELASILAAQNESYFATERKYISLAQNSAYYDLPSDFMKLKQARVAYSTPTGPTSYKVASGYDITEVVDVQADEENVSTTSPIVDIVGAQIKVKPTPTSAVTNGLQINYIARPSALALSASSPLLPTEWQDLLATYGAKEMCLRFNKWEKWQALESVWQKGIERMKVELAERDTNEPLRFKSPYDAGTGRSVTELYS